MRLTASRLRARSRAAAEMAVELAKEAAVAFPPLQAGIGPVAALVKRQAIVRQNIDTAEDLRSRAAMLASACSRLLYNPESGEVGAGELEELRDHCERALLQATVTLEDYDRRRTRRRSILRRIDLIVVAPDDGVALADAMAKIHYATERLSAFELNSSIVKNAFELRQHLILLRTEVRQDGAIVISAVLFSNWACRLPLENSRL